MNTNTTEKPSPKKNELAIRLENRGVDPMLWNAIGSSIFPGASDESKLMAIDYCKSRGLDIMKKPCHIVPMNVKDAKTGQYAWRDVIMPGIAEIRITAERTGKYAGQDGAIFGPSVEIKFGSVTHSVPESCTVTVYKWFQGQRIPYAHTEYFEEAANTTKDGSLNSMWTKRKRGQLSKCAEAGALRKAFPEETGGIIVAEEATDEHIRQATGRVVVDSPKLTDSYEPQEATPDPEPAQSLEPVPESPVEVTEATERAQLIEEIKAILKFQGSTLAKFGPMCKKHGFLADEINILDAPIEDLRVIHGNVVGILAME